MSTPTLARALLRDFETQLVDATLDEGPIEDLLSFPRFTLTRVIKTVDAIALVNHTAAITHIGEVQSHLAQMLQAIDSVLPRQAAELTMHQARPKLAGIVADVPQLIDWLQQLDPFVSSFGELWK
ncbi:MAG TPA: hypothetical protein VHC91_21940 [Trinickia sp.]|uniref:hypothetical protein n=1 Tax=Trinickia sp. TaxID=2571163 RepID=UPI002C853812|nr:hypothetical protein [Trinickia sp.]HVW53026.1 hypothetical protein [Trinickia sp.]